MQLLRLLNLLLGLLQLLRNLHVLLLLLQGSLGLEVGGGEEGARGCCGGLGGELGASRSAWGGS